MRRLEIPVDLRLDRLHLILQAAMGWTNTHLYEFRIRDIGWGIPDPEWDFGSGPLDGRKSTLLKVVDGTGVKTFKYLYDFGDGWEHPIRIERIAPADPDVAYPILIDAVGRCPPEDVGGPPGMKSSWKRSPTRSTSATPKCTNGSVRASIPRTSTPLRSARPANSPPMGPQDEDNARVNAEVEVALAAVLTGWLRSC